MKHITPANWGEDFTHDGLLFFTQRINEMLFHYTGHVNKAPVYNTYFLIHEFLSTCDLVEEGAVNQSHLSSIMEEFQDSFLSDVVIAEHLDERAKKDILEKLNTSSLERKKDVMGFLYHYLEDYNIWCQDYLRTIVPQEREKKKIEKAIKCFVPGVIAAGYSREFVYHFNREVFAETPVTSIESLEVFLSRFDFKNRKYDVYVAIVKEALAFRDILKNRLSVDFGPFEDKDELKYDNNKYILVRMSVEEFDEQKAAHLAFFRLDIFFNFYRFFGDQKSDWFFNKAQVEDSHGHKAFVNLKYYGLSYSDRNERSKTGKFSEIIITELLSKAPQSFEKIDLAVRSHNNAIDDPDIQNRYLNLWSTLEIIFVSDRDDSKINEIKKKLIPILLKDYIHYQYELIEQDISDNIGMEKLDEIKRRMEDKDDPYWLYYLISLKKYAYERTSLYDLLSDFPLIRSRISQFSELCSSKKKLEVSILAFKRRIEWHITRLYRARNVIIHSGTSPHSLKELVEHLHSYVDESLLEIMLSLSNDGSVGSIGNAILRAQFKENSIIRRLQSKDELEKDDVVSIFSDEIFS